MISELLKTQTRHLHDLTEAKFNSEGIFSGTFSLEDYTRLLQHNYALLAATEEQIFARIPASAASDINLPQRRKLPLVIQDLQVLEVPVSPNIKPMSIKNTAEAWGLLYVMEGATIGGTMMAKQLSANAAFIQAPFAYFRIYGDHTGSRWKNFKEILDREMTTEAYSDCICGAEKAYHFLLQWAE